VKDGISSASAERENSPEEMAIPQSQKVPQSIMRLVLAERERGPGA